MKKLLIIAAVSTLASISARSESIDLRTVAFQNIELSYTTESEAIGGMKMSGSGIALSGSYLITKNIYGLLDYTTVSVDGTDGIDSFDLKLSGIGFGAGYRSSINDSMDAYGSFNISSPYAKLTLNGVEILLTSLDYRNYTFGIASYSDNLISKLGISSTELDGDKTHAITLSSRIVLDNKAIVGVDLEYNLDATEFGLALHAGMSL
jgi:hypothetical protein